MSGSPIAFKGFMFGYLHKTAAKAGGMPNVEVKPPAGQEADTAKDAAAAAAAVDQPPKPPGKYDDLGKQLKDLWPGAAAGGVAVGAGSVGVDAMQGKPANMRRALLLSVILGIPLGAAAQMGIQGGTDAYKKFGTNVAGASKQVLSDVLRKGGEWKQKAKGAWDSGKDKVKTAVKTGV
jgi:hypothetical protein